MRVALSKKIRFEVFKRDLFVCQYCGKTPPAVTLEVDHINPVAEGGGNDLDNLITACFDCNRGKGATPLAVCPPTIPVRAETIKEREAQLAGLAKVQAKQRLRIAKDANYINQVFQTKFPTLTFSESFLNGTLTMFLRELSVSEVEDAMVLSLGRITDSGACIKYFCGVCWNKIRGVLPPRRKYR